VVAKVNTQVDFPGNLAIFSLYTRKEGDPKNEEF
jgi:hypothetical protein